MLSSSSAPLGNYISHLLQVTLLLTSLVLFSPTSGADCIQGDNCRLPNCFCPTFQHPSLPVLEIPQIVYFGFDDAVQPQVSGYYDQLFTADRKNPNGCPITMSLYVSDEYTQYSKVHDYYERGMEIASHSVTHQDIDTGKKLRKEAEEEKKNLINKGNVPASDVVGWRSPNLKTAGDEQPDILASLKYTYDISLSYNKDFETPWPFTLDFGYPYPCSIPPCPGVDSSHPGFWEVIVRGFTNPVTGLSCGYVDGCRPDGEDAALEYLWYNFLKTYEAERAPFGLNMHAAWFAYPEYLRATERFIDRLLGLSDIYIINVKQMLDWMRKPTSLAKIETFKPWSCSDIQTTTQASSTSSTTSPPPSSSSLTLSITAQTRTTSKSSVLPPSFIQIQFPRIMNVPQNPLESDKTRLENRTNMTSLGILRFTENSGRSNSQRNSSKPQPSSSQQFSHPMIAIDRPSQQQAAGYVNNSESSQGQLLGRRDGKACLQSVNCYPPSCFCRSLSPPSKLSSVTIPQIVYLAIDSHIDARTFPPLMQVFSGFRKNPNGCPISATIFSPITGNNPLYVNVLKAKGVYIGVNGGGFSALYSDSLIRQRVLSHVTSISTGHLTKNFGWRGYASLSPTDAVFQALSEGRVSFDSSVMIDSTDLPWPYTLDFGLNDSCSVMASRCPKANYPGLWEVPISAFRFTDPHQTCYFLDTCPYSANSEEEVFNLLFNNFLLHYNGGKSPFGINLHSEWLVGHNKSVFQKGLLRFFDEVLRQGDVVVVSIEQMLKWMSSPVLHAQNFPC
ncbi:chitin deacetylase isoform b [Plakobranchus ocellatus]|uniref:Chitin deacetylase isoform b n=1 Tax=Plakobranchus ocellatus TaxID=259542 RepID=A0AAV4B6M0_9GAST|nr:chitin deacetylase isoform b [Plakobranchus ocellatus]